MGKLRILLFDEIPERSRALTRTLVRLGYEVVAVATDPRDLHDTVALHAPDIIIIETESPSRDTLENLAHVSNRCPRPVVMFARDGDREAIRQATGAGVTAYVVDGLAPERVEPIVEAAIARFEAYQRVREELLATRSELADRKTIDRAKALLMREKGLSEDAAYHGLRKLAMDRNKTIAQVADDLLAMARLLG
jgi:response regulator NasT